MYDWSLLELLQRPPVERVPGLADLHARQRVLLLHDQRLEVGAVRDDVAEVQLRALDLQPSELGADRAQALHHVRVDDVLEGQVLEVRPSLEKKWSNSG